MKKSVLALVTIALLSSSVVFAGADLGGGNSTGGGNSAGDRSIDRGDSRSHDVEEGSGIESVRLEAGVAATNTGKAGFLVGDGSNALIHQNSDRAARTFDPMGNH